ncbi:MAG: thioredoxin family protein [Phycisphaerales bacterium]|nr:thioredoxin family protein [Phycisphaerales bacterium]
MFTTLICCLAALASPKRESSWPAALIAAKETGWPIIALAHGSDWCVRGETLKRSVWDRHMGLDKVVLVALDIRESPDERDAEVLEGFDVKQVRTFPAFLAFEPDGTRIATLGGESLTLDLESTRTELATFSAAARKRVLLQRQARTAAASGNVAAEVSALHGVLDQNLEVPKSVLERLEEIDPADAGGKRRRASFGHFHNLVHGAVRETRQGQAQDAINRLQGMLAADVYTPEQQAWIHNALGSVYRHSEGKDELAERHYKMAHTTAPETVAGKAGRRMAQQLYGHPSIEMGWEGRHLTDQYREWRIEGLPDVLEPGVWTVTFNWKRGRHGLDVAEVRLFDGNREVAADVHKGFTGHNPSQNVYTLRVPSIVRSPQLKVQAKGAGGRDGRGEIVLKQL